MASLKADFDELIHRIEAGRVAICVGIDFGVFSGELKLSFHAARSMA